MEGGRRMRYIIDAPSNLYKIGGTLRVPVKVGEGDLCWYNTYLKAESYNEPDRKTIEDEVWEFAGKIFEMDMNTYAEIYDKGFNSYQDAKSKYEAWLNQKDETFDTGDEVYDKEIDSKGVILRRYNSDTLDILWDDGSAGETIAIKAITKTGRHFDEVAELLEKMRGGE